ncbi:hypothetical protein ACWEQO_05495 [Streptomyces sp. NPDC004051]
MPTATIGHVTRERYEQITASDREPVGQTQRIQLAIGDHALEIEPVQQIGGAHPAPGEDLFDVDASLRICADDLGLTLSTVRSYRFAAHRWPAGQPVRPKSETSPRTAWRRRPDPPRLPKWLAFLTVLGSRPSSGTCRSSGA